MRFTPATLLQRLTTLPRAGRYLVAFSGGLDSTVLLHSLHRLGAKLSVPVEAVHVNHGLMAQADAWQAHCAAFCRERDIPLRLHRLGLHPVPGESLEALAREARYMALAAGMREGDAVLTAHHRDDQVETLLLLLLRGSGARGLSGMPPARPFGPGSLQRPLLDVDRRMLESYARREGLRWIDDLSNHEARFDRNYLRHAVLPLLHERWPQASTTIARTAELCAETESLVGQLAAMDLRDVVEGDCLSVDRLCRLSAARQRALLRLWIGERGLPVPDRRRLLELQRQMIEARPDRVPRIAWRGAEVYRYRGRLHAQGPLPPMDASAVIPWPSGASLPLPAGLGVLRLTTADSPGPLEVRFRAAGASCEHEGMHRSVKKIFQEHGVPPWLRQRVPLLFAGGRLVAVGDYVAPAWAQLRWERGPGWPANRSACADSTQ